MVLIAIGGGGFLVFYVTHREEVPYTHRKHAVFVSPETEMVLGLETFKQVGQQIRSFRHSWTVDTQLWSLVSDARSGLSKRQENACCK